MSIKKAIQISLIVFMAVLICSCSARQKGHRDEYVEYVHKANINKQTTLAVVSGSIYDYETHQPLKGAGAIKIDDVIKCKTDINGNFLFAVQPGRYRFTGAGYPYQFYQTKAININPGDTLKLKFYLKPNTKTIN